MPPNTDSAKLSVRQFAEQFRNDMIPLSNSISYFCASEPMTDEDLKEYLEEPVAALPPNVASALPKLAILLVPYLERGNGRDGAGDEVRAASLDAVGHVELAQCSIERVPAERVIERGNALAWLTHRLPPRLGVAARSGSAGNPNSASVGLTW